jgi:RNA polymerase sigma-70 factor (ECF subfamily)
MISPHQFEGFMRNYQNMVYSTAYRLLGNAADAEDITQEAFLKAYTHFDELRDNPAAPGWLKTVTRNLALNHLTRYRNRWRVFSDFGREDEEAPDFANRLAETAFTDQAAATADQRQLLEAALQRLPDAQRVPLVLYHFEHLSYDEIARHLRISVGKVKTDIHRGRAALRRHLTLDWKTELT